VKLKHTGARLALHLKDVLECGVLTNGRLFSIMINYAFSNDSMSPELQSTLEASWIV
jgi:hypothetical protein